MKDLAEAASISTNTVARFENRRNDPNPVTLKAIRQAFEAAGVKFTVDGGVIPPPTKEQAQEDG